MNAPPGPIPNGPGKLSEHLRFIYSELRRLQPIFGPGEQGARTSRGVVRVPGRAVAGGGSLAIQTLVSVREGYDAVECTNEDDETVYCLKPPGFRTDGRIDGVFSVKGFVRGPLETTSGYSSQFHEYKETHYLWDHGGAPATRVDRLIKTENSDNYGDDAAAPGRGISAFSIFPYYTEIVGSGDVDGQQVQGLACPALKLDSDELTIDPAGDVDATFVDIGARAWVPIGALAAGSMCNEFESRVIAGIYYPWVLRGYA